MSATRTPSDAVIGSALRGADLRAALTDAYDGWLRGLAAGLPPGTALTAVGGLGRREPAPYSDLDLVLLHTGRVRGIAEVAESIWYPIWDSGIALDHSVRTPDQALDVARDDLKAVLGLLDLRHIAGDAGVFAPLRERVLGRWRATAAQRVADLHDLCRARWKIAGEAAFLLEPNLKDSRGGLRDAALLRALATAQLVDDPPAVRDARTLLLDVRGELHRRSGRDTDVLRQQDQADLADALGRTGADAVLRAVNEASRTVALSLDTALRRVTAAQPARRGLRGIIAARPPARAPLARDVVAQDGEVVLARDADPWTDPGLVLRMARAAVENELPIAPFALQRLAAESGPVPQPWPSAMLDDLLALLGAGPAAVPVLETLDEAGLLVRLLPEWAAVRFLAQRNPVHRFTVDRHLLETAACAAELTRHVARPDLLLIGALLHDIGKGLPGADHSVTGAAATAVIAHRVGLGPADADSVAALVRHHLLLPDTATRRDLDDPVTARIVVDAVAGSRELLELLHALTVADARATGPGAWSDWKAVLVADLVRRASDAMGGRASPPAQPLDGARRRLAQAATLAVEIHGDEILVAAPDRPGVLSRAAGVLAMHHLDVRSASIRTYSGMAVNSFVVAPRFGRVPDPALLMSDLARAVDGALDLPERLLAKERSYAPSSAAPAAQEPTVHWFDGEATDATVLELRADDAIGLLYRVTATLERCGLDVRAARVSSFGHSVVDAFYLTTSDGGAIPEQDRPAIAAQLLRVSRRG